MRPKIKRDLYKSQHEKFLRIMADYDLTHKHIMYLLNVSYTTVKNWRAGTTFFNKDVESLLLDALKSDLKSKATKLNTEF